MRNEGCRRQTSRVDWLYLALVAVMLVALLALFIGWMRVYINRGYFNTGKHRHKPSRIRRAKGEYHPPEPPEGRYWG